MANSLFNALNGRQTNPMQQLVADAKRLQQTMNGDPRKMVESLIKSGQMSQQDFDRYAQIANQIVGSGAFK